MRPGVWSAVACLAVWSLAACVPSPAVPGVSPTHLHGSSPPPAGPLRAGERFVVAGLPRPDQPTAPAGGTDEMCVVTLIATTTV